MRKARKRGTGVRDRGEEPGTGSSFDAAKRKFKEGAVLLSVERVNIGSK
jgi:hypothetical protein